MSHTTCFLQHKTEHVRDMYTLGRSMGKVLFSIMYFFVEKGTDKVYACISISKRNILSIKDVEDVRREI